MILEGTRSDLNDQHMSREAIQGALITLTLIYGIPLLRSQNPLETAHLIYMAADQAQRHAQAILHRPGASRTQTRKAQSYLLQGLPGIGKVLSMKIIQHFPTLKAAFNASVAQWQEIPGIGSEKAKAICQLLEAQAAQQEKTPES